MWWSGLHLGTWSRVSASLSVPLLNQYRTVWRKPEIRANIPVLITLPGTYIGDRYSPASTLRPARRRGATGAQDTQAHNDPS